MRVAADRNIQPASLDLRLGAFAWALRCSFLPDARSTVMDRVADLAPTGVFTPVITERNSRFDEVAPGYSGKLYLEVVPRSYAVRVTELMSLNQLRLAVGEPLVRDADLPSVQEESPLLYMDSGPVPRERLAITDGLFLSIDLSCPPDAPVGFRARRRTATESTCPGSGTTRPLRFVACVAAGRSYAP